MYSNHAIQKILPENIDVINLIGIPTLGTFFGKEDKMTRSDNEGTWVKWSDTKFQFVWDYDKHEIHSVHVSSGLPEL